MLELKVTKAKTLAARITRVVTKLFLSIARISLELQTVSKKIQKRRILEDKVQIVSAQIE